MKRFSLALVFAAVVLSTTVTDIASAQEILLEGPLAGAPAVRKLVHYREMRFSAGLQFGYTINDDYMHNFMPGARLEFNVTDWLGIGVVGYYVFNVPRSLTDYITNSKGVGGSETIPTNSNFPSYTGARNFEKQVGLVRGMYLGQVSVVPLRGKMSMFQRVFVAIDGSIFVGGGVIHLEERENCVNDVDNGIATCGTVEDPIVKRATRFAPTFTVGINIMAYFTEFFAVNLEYRMTPFKWNAGGTDESGHAAPRWAPNASGTEWVQDHPSTDGDYPDGRIDEKDRTWNMNQSLSVGFIFYLPTTPRLGE